MECLYAYLEHSICVLAESETARVSDSNPVRVANTFASPEGHSKLQFDYPARGTCSTKCSQDGHLLLQGELSRSFVESFRMPRARPRHFEYRLKLPLTFQMAEAFAGDDLMGVGPWIAAGCGYGQPFQVMRPTLLVAGAFLCVRQTAMGQADERPAILVNQVDLDQA